MKFLILALCLGCVLANESLLDELDKILSDDSKPVRRVDSKTSDPLRDIIHILSEDSNKERIENTLDHLEKRLSSSESLDFSEKQIGSDESLDALDDAPRYGYCVDGVSKAVGPNKEGCARAACYDEVSFCDSRFSKELSIKDERARTKAINSKCRASLKSYTEYRRDCPFTCGMCTPRSPQKDCEQKYGSAAKRYGCCAVGGTPALGPNKEGCLPCSNFYPHVCMQFMKKRFGIPCHTGAYRVRTFLYKYCPKACNLCKPGEL